MQLRRLVFLNLITILFIGCKSHEKAIGEAPIILDNFNFETNIKDIYPDRYKVDGDSVYAFPSSYVKESTTAIDTLYEEYWSSDKTPKGLNYKQLIYTKEDTIAIFENFPFANLNIVTTLDHKKIMMISSFLEEISKTKTDDFVSKLNQKYGKAERVSQNYNEYEVYTWNLKDRTIKYSVLLNERKDPRHFDKTTGVEILNAYFFIIKKEYENVFVDKMDEGALNYCK